MLTILSVVFSFFKGLSPTAWGIIAGVIAVSGGVMYWNHHERDIARQQDATKIATLTLQLSQAQAANGEFDKAIAALKQSLSECEAGRTADAALTAQAKAAYDAQVQTFKLVDAKQRAATQALAKTATCAGVANQPAYCVSVVAP
jgi:hypothetical protein